MMEPQRFVISSSRISSISSSFSIAFRNVFGPWPPRSPSSDHHVFIYSLQNFKFYFRGSLVCHFQPLKAVTPATLV